jgi:drug/metabolite transporter (DMT)-like permease
MSAAVEMTVAGIILTIMALMLGEFANFSFNPNGLYAFIYLIIIGSLVGYASYIYAITHLPVSFVSTYAYINPIIALFLGWFVLDEAVTLNIILASVIILVGVMLVKKGTEIHSLNNVKNES